MKNFFNDNDYYMMKVCERLMVTDNCDKLVEKNDILKTPLFLKYLLKMTKIFTSENVLNAEMKKNLLNYLYYVIQHINRESNMNNIINQIMFTIDSQDKDESIGFFRTEMSKRINNSYLDDRVIPDAAILHFKDSIFNYIKYDQFVLHTHSNKVSNNDFEKKYIPKILGDDRYFKSLNCILNEYPEQFLNRVFYRRYVTVMSELLSLAEDEEKKDIKSITSCVDKQRRILRRKK